MIDTFGSDVSRAPAIETDRLLLRGHRPDDLAACARMWADPGVTRFIGGVAFTRSETWGKLLRYAGLWSLLGFGYWAIEEKATGAFAGELGLADFQRDVPAEYATWPETGWALAPAMHGRGYATEAVRAVLAWSDLRLNAARTVCFITPENVASIGVARKSGYEHAGEIAVKGRRVSAFLRERDWLGRA